MTGGVFEILKREWKDNRLTDAAAALTFYGVLALFPFLLFMVALAGILIQPTQLQEIIGALARDIPPAFSELLNEQLQQLTSRTSGGLLTFSALMAAWSASTGALSLIRALNIAYGVTESRPVWKICLIAVTSMLGAAVIAPLAGFHAVVVPALANKLGPPWSTAVIWLRLPIAAFLMTTLWATLYACLPNTQHKLRFITLGSVVGVLVWLVASLGFSVYVSNFGFFGVTYGALGSIVVLILWMWISSLSLMLGAQINAVRYRS